MASKTRLLLSGTLGGLLLLTALTGASALVIVERIRTGEASLRARVAERAGRLEEIRRGIYLSGTLARDYFADPDGPDAPALLASLKQVESDTTRAVARDAQPLRGEVAAYWRVLDLMAEMARKRRTAGVDAYFRRQLAERRETMLRITAEIGAAVDRETRRGESELAATYRRLQTTMAAVLALVCLFGAALAGGALRRLLRLERETHALSAQLVNAQEKERRAIARELHDEVGQSLSRLMLDLGAAYNASADEVQPRLEAASARTEQAIEAVRRIALALRPSMLDDLGLVAALEWQAREVERHAGFEVGVIAEDGAGDLPDAHRTCIYRVAQEALENCVRHSGASRVQVRLQRQPRGVSLTVADDGKGLPTARTRGLGLLGMAERVEQTGGRLRIQSEAGRGTTVTAELPLA